MRDGLAPREARDADIQKAAKEKAEDEGEKQNHD
jgi:hypothetical protein